MNDHMSTISGKLLRPRILEVEPLLVDSSQAPASSRRGSVVTARCSWALLSSAMDSKQSAGALFTFIRSAYYSIIRQYVVGFNDPDDQFKAIAARLDLQEDVISELLVFRHQHGSLLQAAGAQPDIVSFLRDMNVSTWVIIDGSEQVTQTWRGARPGESIADLMFIFSLPTLLKKLGHC